MMIESASASGMKKSLHITGLLVSSVFLAAVLVLNTELFFFAKTFTAPQWTKPFPDPYFAAGLLVFFCLLPATFLAKSAFSSIKTLAVTLAIAPIPALLIYGLKLSGDLISNVTLQYIWIVVTGFIPPALIALLVSWLAKHLMKKVRTQ